MKKMIPSTLEQLKPSPEALVRLLEQMEEYAGKNTSQHGKRQPGERGMYEIQRQKRNEVEI